MTRLIRLIVATLIILPPALILAQDKTDEKPAPSAPPPAGTWKLFLPFIGEEGTADQVRAPVRFTKKDDKWQGSLVAKAKNWPKSTIEKVSVSNKELTFTLTAGSLPVVCNVQLPKDAKGTKLYGSAAIRKRSMPLELESTTLSSLEPYALLKERFDKQPLGYQAVQTGLQMLGQSEAQKVDPKAVRACAEKVVRSAALYGTSFQRDVVLGVAATLTEEVGYEKIGLEYARRAERSLDPKEPPSLQKRVLDVLISALEKNKLAEDVKTAKARLAKLDFSIKVKPYAGRKDKSNRAVLVELFTGAECPPCVAADLAFDALGKTYKPSEAILLQYHLHIPGPDPLSNPETVGRQGFYDQAVEGTPTILFNGKAGAPGGGVSEDASEKYDEYREVINPLLETPAEAGLKVSASQKDSKITIGAEVTKLAEPGDDVRLRVALVEDTVKYKGRNGLTAHHHVVRSMPSGVSGLPIKEKNFKKTFTVDLTELRKKLKEYLEKYDMKRPFPNKERPLEMKKLHVVAFIQNDKTGEVLQAVQVDIKGE